MRKLIIGSGLALVALGGAASATDEKPTAAGAVSVTNGKGAADDAQCQKATQKISTESHGKKDVADYKIKVSGDQMNRSSHKWGDAQMKHSDKKWDGVDGAQIKHSDIKMDCSSDIYMK
jgi:hypothetical protein